jgi:BolA protein
VFDSLATAEKIRAILEREFRPLLLEVEDQSHYHIGHKSAGGGGHFFVTIRSARFNGLPPLARQRLVIESMGPMMDREIHALSMRCLPE